MLEKKLISANEEVVENLTIKERSLWQDAAERFSRNKMAVLSLWVLGLIVAFVVIAPLVSPFSYDDTDWDMISIPPDWASGHFFGTDMTGRDLLVRVAEGGRISFAIGLIASALCLLLGVALGASAGFLGGRFDFFFMRVVELLESIPGMFLYLLVIAILGNSVYLLFFFLGGLSWTGIARMVRGITLSLKRREFIEAAITCGVSKPKIILKHIVPNVLGIVIIKASALIPGMMLAESALSFLGLGVQEPLSSWGALISDGSAAVIGAIWLLIFPSLFLVTTLLCFLFIGDGLRDAFDPKDH